MTTKKKGFSLVEIMVIVVIIGILAAVGVPKLMGTTERTKRKIDSFNAIELAKVLERAYESNIIEFPSNTSYSVNVNGQRVDAGKSVAVFVTKGGINFYRGSGDVLVNGGDYHSDNGVAYRRVQRLFEEAGFTNVTVNAHKGDGGWECYGAALFAGGTIKIFSSDNSGDCQSTTKAATTKPYSTRLSTATILSPHTFLQITSSKRNLRNSVSVTLKLVLHNLESVYPNS